MRLTLSVKTPGLFVLVALLVLALAACGGAGPTPPPANPAPAPSAKPATAKAIPADHTRDKGGRMHKTGMKEPLANCTPCHGQDLKGTAQAQSCYACHAKNWH